MDNSDSKRRQEAIPIKIVFESETSVQAILKELVPSDERHLVNFYVPPPTTSELAKASISSIEVLGYQIILWIRDVVIPALFVNWLLNELQGRKVSSIRIGNNQIPIDKDALTKAIARELAKDARKHRRNVRAKRSERSKAQSAKLG